MGNIISIQDLQEKKILIEDAKTLVILHKQEAFKFFDEGTTRYVYVNQDNTKVIKLNKTESGFDWNTEELKIYQNATEEDKAQMAKTEMTNGFIEQDFCIPIKFGGKRLSISERLFAASCRNEVGWSREGTLICFDLDEFKKY